jgi:hypothetical protein
MRSYLVMVVVWIIWASSARDAVPRVGEMRPRVSV